MYGELTYIGHAFQALWYAFALFASVAVGVLLVGFLSAFLWRSEAEESNLPWRRFDGVIDKPRQHINNF